MTLGTNKWLFFIVVNFQAQWLHPGWVALWSFVVIATIVIVFPTICQLNTGLFSSHCTLKYKPRWVSMCKQVWVFVWYQGSFVDLGSGNPEIVSQTSFQASSVQTRIPVFGDLSEQEVSHHWLTLQACGKCSTCKHFLSLCTRWNFALILGGYGVTIMCYLLPQTW